MKKTGSCQMVTFYKEVLDSLIANNVKFVLICGFAVNAYGFQRATGDMDLLIEPSEDNIEQLLKSIDVLGFDRLEAKKVSFSSCWDVASHRRTLQSRLTHQN